MFRTRIWLPRELRHSQCPVQQERFVLRDAVALHVRQGIRKVHVSSERVPSDFLKLAIFARPPICTYERNKSNSKLGEKQ